jgi:hypothetical protein
MQEKEWTDERVIKALEKSGRHTLFLSHKSRSKIEKALMQENERLRSQKPTQKQRSALSRLLASFSNQ